MTESSGSEHLDRGTRDRPLKVVYVAGNGRSGSTLLDVILGQVPGFFPVGEVRNVWDYGLLENRPCGCGVPFRECPTWSAVFRDPLLADHVVEPRQMAAWRERFGRTKRLLPIFATGASYLQGQEIRRYLDVTERLYHAIARTTGAFVVLDSSKWPAYAFLLDGIESIDLHVLHLVRDARACAFSWTRLKEAEPGRYLERQSAVYTTTFWVVWNAAIRRLFGKRAGRYMLLRYEDFAEHPRSSIEAVLRFVGEGKGGPFVDDHTVQVVDCHAIEGNAAKFARGNLQIRPDTEWLHAMPSASKAIVTAMAWPWLRRYGYLRS